jgi:hypothetical protein
MDIKSAWFFCYIQIVGWQLHPRNGKSTLSDDELCELANLADRMALIYAARFNLNSQEII